MSSQYCSLMGDRLERTEVWQAYHDRVTGEIPVVVSDSERLDMFRPGDPMHDDDPAPRSYEVDGFIMGPAPR